MSGWSARASACVLLLAVLAAGFFQLHNYDIPLHARTGEWIVEHGEVPSTNVMSRLHAAYPDVQDKWGFQVVAHLLLDGLGPNACIAARLGLMLAIFAVLAGMARRLGAGPWWTLLFLLLALVAARSRFAFRPDLVSLLFTVLVARALLVPPRGSGRSGARGLAWLVALQVVWVNVHGYFITGPFMVLVAAGARALASPAVARASGGPAAAEERRAAKRLALTGAAMSLACLLNPAGLEGALHPFAILEDLDANRAFYTEAIIEFRPTFAEDPRRPFDRAAYFLLGGAAGLLLLREALAALPRRVPPADRPAGEPADPASQAAPAGAGHPAAQAAVALALAVLFGAMSFSLRRNMAPFAVVVAPLAAAAATRRLRLPRALAAPAAAAGAAATVALAGLVAWGELSDATSVHDGLDRRAGLGLSRIAYPDHGIAFVARHLSDRSVFTSFRFGSAFTGSRWPEQAASLDGNTHGYPTAYLREVSAAVAADDARPFALVAERDGHDAALLPIASPLSVALLNDPAWALVEVGVREALWVRRAAMDAVWLLEHDLLGRWRDGEPVDLPGTPCDPPLAGLPRRCAPLAEIDQSLLLLAAGLPGPALERARAAARLVPHDREAPALQAMIFARLGRRDEALRLAAEALSPPPFAAPAVNRFAEEARMILARG